MRNAKKKHNNSECLTSDAGLKFFGQMIQTVNAANRIFKYRPKYIAAERTVPNTLLTHCEGKRSIRTSTIEEVKKYCTVPRHSTFMGLKKLENFF